MDLTFGCVLSQAAYGPMAGPTAIRTLAQRAETLGFHTIWFADHIVIPRHVKPFYPYEAGGASPFDAAQPFFEPLSVLNFLAGCTERIRLGMHVLIIPYREPVFTAKILATLDALSGGRLTLGAGAGWMGEEFAALGLSNFAERGAVTNEYLLLFKELWTKENPEFHGKYVKVSDIGFLPKPLQRPHPPIWIGGHSLAALRRVALVGDGWMPIALRPPSLLRPPENGGQDGPLAETVARCRARRRRGGNFGYGSRRGDEDAGVATAPSAWHPRRNRRRFAAIPGSGHPELQRQFARRRYRSAERSDGSVYAGGRAARRLTRTGRDLDRPRRAG